MTYHLRPTAEDPEPRRIGFVGFDGVSSFDLFGPLEAFAAARLSDVHGERYRCYETIVIGMTGRTLISNPGAVIKARYTLQSAPLLDIIIVPGSDGLRNSETGRTISAWLTERARTTPRIAAISAGIYPLASTGLLDGRGVATHWRIAHDVARAFPALAVRNGAPFVKSDRFYTCGGGVAAIEMSLALIEEDFGAKTALAVARELGIDLRPAGAAHQIALPEHQPGPAERLAELPTWITSRLHYDLTVEVLAERACLSPRHFYRLFKETFKSTPAAFVEQLRINEAHQRLAAQRENVESVASSVGFKSAAVFRRAFGRRLGYSPSEVRRGAKPKPQRLCR